jgi:hypothetical protein
MEKEVRQIVLKELDRIKWETDTLISNDYYTQLDKQKEALFQEPTLQKALKVVSEYTGQKFRSPRDLCICTDTCKMGKLPVNLETTKAKADQVYLQYRLKILLGSDANTLISTLQEFAEALKSL